jgi:hypothetical protein
MGGMREQPALVGSIAVLAIASTATRRTHGNQVVVSHWPNILRAQRHQRLCPARRRHEFDTQRSWTVHLDNSAQIPQAQAMFRDIARQHDNIKRLGNHAMPPGYAVTNRGAPPSFGTNHTLRTIAL